jgi:riboflavin kinase/FMN adenylyltransferase
MPMIKLYRRRKIWSSKNNSVVAIGNFDGLHLGHQKILEVTQNIATQLNYIPVLLTFEPYPQQFFHPEKLVPRLTTLREKINIIQRGIIFYALPFDRSLALYTPEKFINEILIQTLNAKVIVVGEDFRFGHQRSGDIKLLKAYLDTQSQEAVLLDGERISSTRVRHALSGGDLNFAKRLLNRNYSITGRVVRGSQRGRLLGFPTANIALNKRIPPLMGVYAVKTNGQYPGVANIGSRPTVDGNGTRIFLEVFIFDFDQDIYGKYITVEFIHKIRDEKRFESVDALKVQIAEDVVAAKGLLN